MKICIVGNVLKDVYLNLDSRSEALETDQNAIKWLDVAFDASEHHYYSRTSTLAGAAISLEVLEKMGVSSFINSAKIRLETDGLVSDSVPDTYRYILIADNDSDRDHSVSYFVPTHPAYTSFTAPDGPIDYLYIDRSAFLSRETIGEIIAYLDISSETKLALYVKDPDDPNLRGLVERADLIFLEESAKKSRHASPQFRHVSLSDTSKYNAFSPSSTAQVVLLNDSMLRVGSTIKSFTPSRINLETHLSVFSIIAGTILGALVQGRSLEDSLDLAIANAENSRLNASLPLSKLEELVKNASNTPSRAQEIELIAANLMLPGKGILAADESGGSISKKFAKMNIPDTYQNRRDYRNIFFTTPDLSKYINGVILFDETSKQFADDGQNFVDYLTSRQIIPGIKVDQGLENITSSATPPLGVISPVSPLGNSNIPSVSASAAGNPDAPVETYTKGLDGLSDRLREYYNNGLRFAKWRAAFTVNLSPSGQILTPSEPAIDENCRILAEYALECQKAGLVPIVEPELVYDGYYSLDQSASITGHILDVLFSKLKDKGVNLKACILKVNMVLAGRNFGVASTPVEVGLATSKVLKEHVPKDLAGVVFLSGGQTPEQATEDLAEIMKNGPFPWPVTFSFARALQDPALDAWAGDNKNSVSAQKAFLARLKANAEALLAVDF